MICKSSPIPADRLKMPISLTFTVKNKQIFKQIKKLGAANDYKWKWKQKREQGQVA